MSEKKASGCKLGCNNLDSGDFIRRSFALVFSLGTFIAVVVALAVNNSVVLPAKTSSLKNISVNIYILGGTFLQNFITIFGEMFITLTAIDLIHSTVRMVLLLLNVAHVTNNWRCFFRIFIFLDSIMLFAHIGVGIGAYLINLLLATHASLDPEYEPALEMINRALQVASCFSGANIAQFFSSVVLSAVNYGRHSKDKCDKKECSCDDIDKENESSLNFTV